MRFFKLANGDSAQRENLLTCHQFALSTEESLAGKIALHPVDRIVFPSGRTRVNSPLGVSTNRTLVIHNPIGAGVVG